MSVLVGFAYMLYGFIAMAVIAFDGVNVCGAGPCGMLAQSAIYLFIEVISIYALLAPFSPSIREAAHIGFCVPWALILILIIPQFLSDPLLSFSLLLLMAASWFVSLLGEEFSLWLRYHVPVITKLQNFLTKR